MVELSASGIAFIEEEVDLVGYKTVDCCGDGMNAHADVRQRQQMRSSRFRSSDAILDC